MTQHEQNNPQTNTNNNPNSLPEGWKWVKIMDIGRIETGSTPSKANPNFYSSDFPFYKPTDLSAGNVWQASDNLSKEGIKQARFLPENSILVTCIGATIGKTGIIRRAGACNQQINAIIPTKEHNPNFVYYQVIAPKFQEAIKNNASATTLPILNKSKFQNLNLVIPPLPIQEAIVLKLEALFSELDKGIANLKAAQAQLKLYKQAVLKWAFEGKLTNPQLAQQTNNPNILPEGWKWVKLGDVCDFQNGFAFKSTTYKETGLPILRISNIQSDVINFNKLVYFDLADYNENLERFKIHKDDLVIAMSGATTGKLGINTSNTIFYLNQRVGKFMPKKELKKQFLYYFLTTNVEKNLKIAIGSAQPNLSTQQINNLKIPLPPLSEQAAIVSAIESRLSICDHITATITQSLVSAEVLRQSILKQAFAGKLI